MSTVGFHPLVGVTRIYLATAVVHRWRSPAAVDSVGAAGCVCSICDGPSSVVVADSFVSGLDEASGRALDSVVTAAFSLEETTVYGRAKRKQGTCLIFS